MSQTLTLKDEGNSKQEALIEQSFFPRICPGPLLAGYCSDPACMADLHADGGSFTTRLRIHHCIRHREKTLFSSTARLSQSTLTQVAVYPPAPPRAPGMKR